MDNNDGKAQEPEALACLRAFPSHRKYDVIVMDPPWSYYRSSCKTFQGVVPYPTMDSTQLASLPLSSIANTDCALLVWCTGPHLPTVFPLFRAWGFSYKTVFLVWRKVYKSGKPVCGPGWYTRPCHEYLLLAVKGSVLRHKQSSKLSQLLDEGDQVHVVTTPEGHSIKPDAATQVIEEFFGGATTTKIELFARKRRFGWDTWGLDNKPYYRCGIVGDVDY